jgi:hypothetical protein
LSASAPSPRRRLATLLARLFRRRPRAERSAADARLALADEAAANALADLVIEIESGGNSELFIPATGALGPGQFLEATWLKLIAVHQPDLAALSRQEILARRTDPVLAREMVVRLLAEHMWQLRAAGLAPTGPHLYLAHFLGLPAAVRTLKAAPGTSMAELVSAAALTHNPTILRGKTAAEIRDWAERSVGVAALRLRRGNRAAGSAAR